MKKLLSLVLICAMGFGMVSCVESEESPSVEAIRNAKAAQLTALANYYNAQAEAEKIAAQAEAAYKLAYAEYWKGYGAYYQSQADYKAEELKQLKEKFAYEIEKLKAQYERDMLLAKKTAMEYEKQILEMANQKLEQLYATYSGYVQGLNEANYNLLEKKTALAKVEAEIVNVTEAATLEILENTALIALAEEKLAILTDNVYANMDVDSLYTEYLKAMVAHNDADYDYQNTEVKAYNEAKEAAEEASTKFFEDIAKVNATPHNNDLVVLYDGDDNWSNEVTDYDLDIPYVWVKKVSGDWDNDPSTPDTEKEVDATQGEPGAYIKTVNVNGVNYPLISWNSATSDGNGHYGEFTFNIGVNPFTYIFNDEANVLSVSIDETELLSFKNTAASDLKTAQEDLEAAEEQLAIATKAQELMAGFEEDFKKAAEAKQALADFADAYSNYNDVDETVNYAENNLKTVKADTTTTTPYSTLYLREAELDVLTNDKNKSHATNEFVKALADAKADLAAATTDAAKAAAQTKVDNAQKALDDAIYKAEVNLVSAKDVVAKYEADVKEAEAKVAQAKENEQALLAANTAALAAAETLNNIFGEESDFYAFWNTKDDNGNFIYYDGNTVSVLGTTTYFLLADWNEDGTPDLNIDTNNGLYYVKPVDSYLFTVTINLQYYEDYAEIYKALVAEYESWFATATDNVKDNTYDIEKLNEWVADWDAKEAELREFVKAKNEEIPEIDALYEAKAAAEEAKDAAKAEVDELKAKYEALGKILNSDSTQDIQDEIEEIEEEIAKAQKAIKGAEYILESLKGAAADWSYSADTIAYRENLVESYKADIAALEAEVEYYTQMVEIAKAALDAELSAQQAE